MKTRFFALAALALILFLAVGTFSHTTAHAEDSSDSPQYGLIITSDALFYINDNDSATIDNVYFNLPETYFVRIIEPSGELMYKAEYDGIIGYIRRSDVGVKDYEPLSKYPTDLRLEIVVDSPSLYVRSQPTRESAEITTIPSGTTNITYYNYVNGQEFMQGNSKWYYISVDINGAPVYGYVYSAYIRLLTNISQPNDTSPKPAPSTPPPSDKTPINYGAITQGIIIAAICIPSVLVIYLLFKPNRSKQVSHSYTQEQPYNNDPYNNHYR